MCQSILLCKSVGVDGVVFGILKEDKELNLEAIKTLVDLAKPLNVVIHKAIDETANPYEGMRQLQQVEGVNGILTSGGAVSALDGIDMLQKMTIHQEDLLIIVAGGVTIQNRERIHNLIGAKEYHGKLIVGNLG